MKFEQIKTNNVVAISFVVCEVCLQWMERVFFRRCCGSGWWEQTAVRTATSHAVQRGSNAADVQWQSVSPCAGHSRFRRKIAGQISRAGGCESFFAESFTIVSKILSFWHPNFILFSAEGILAENCRPEQVRSWYIFAWSHTMSGYQNYILLRCLVVIQVQRRLGCLYASQQQRELDSAG